MPVATSRLLFVLPVILIACGRDSVVEIGVIEHFGEAEGVIEAPASTILGRATQVRVNTFGSDCVSSEWMSVEYLSDTEVELTPYDRRSEGICPANLRMIPHEEEIVFSKRGTVTVRVVGRRVDQQTDELTEVRRRIEVE